MVFITVPDKKEAENISAILIDSRIAACVNIIENIKSNFWWKGKKENIKECLLIVKTRKSFFKKIVKTVKSAHSYDVPEIIAIPIIAGYEPYLDWIEKSTSKLGSKQ